MTDQEAKIAQVKASVNSKLIETGEKDRLKEILRTRLEKCGWRAEMKTLCQDIIVKRGVENTTVEDLVKEITPKGRAQVPAEVKGELLALIRSFLAGYAQQTQSR
eukprot:TRINITY_DN6167_c1_g1_i2.p1 TRINITY_DN6167_c1_g1~~TRINITY_DN6167_c1_g1_i2.p1  ORF type:complete len:114 (-),score=23.28 TRINITY_DN6167_c1_g1_i2:229-543(-)